MNLLRSELFRHRHYTASNKLDFFLFLFVSKNIYTTEFSLDQIIRQLLGLKGNADRMKDVHEKLKSDQLFIRCFFPNF